MLLLSALCIGNPELTLYLRNLRRKFLDATSSYQSVADKGDKVGKKVSEPLGSDIADGDRSKDIILEGGLEALSARFAQRCLHFVFSHIIIRQLLLLKF